MTRVFACACVLVGALAVWGWPAVSAQTPRMPVSEIRPGMVGEGTTVFSGTTRESFKAHVLGVLANVLGPRRNLILARLEGGPLAETGVIAGMSGSPVYIDGRLVGAVSYSLGAFSKEPIAGITPIDEMVELADPAVTSRRPPAGRVAFDLPLDHEAMAAVLRRAFADAAFATRPDAVRVVAGGHLADLATSLRPIATPLSVGGLGRDSLDLLSSFFRDTGFVPVAAGAAPGSAIPPMTGPLQPGDAVGVGLVTGDLSLSGTGTVTLVEGSRVFAFGHPFFNLGPTAFPMTRAWVHTVLPSLFSSTKIASAGEVIGTIQQDRATAIAGTLGPGPAMIPMRLTLEGARGHRRTFDVRVVNDQLFTPLLTYVSILSVLQSYEREAGAASFAVRGEARVKGYASVALEDLFAGDAPSVPAATYVVTPLNILLRNDLAPVEIEGLDVTITAAEEPRRVTIERAWVDEPRVRPGQTVTLKVLTRTYRGEERVRTLPVPIPPNARGTLSLLVSDGARLAQWEQREWRRALDAQSVAQLIRVFNTARKNNRLYVRLISPEPGAVVNGEPMPALPPSVLSVYEADRDGGRVAPIRQAVLGEWDVPTDYAVSGSRLLSLTVEPY